MAVTRTVAVKRRGNAVNHIQRIATKLGSGGTVRVGFLEGRTYPASDSSEFIKKMNEQRLEAAVAKASTRQLLNGGKVTAPKPRSARARRARMADLGIQTSLSVAQVAFWQNFGTKRAKARPFFSNTIDELKPTLGERLAKVAKATGFDTAKTLALMGTGIKDKIVKSIVDWPADNADFTVALKGFNKGLIHHGIMQRSVDFEVKT